MKIEQLIEKGDATAQLVRAALNILMESPYFYKEDDERAFLTVLRYRQAFAAFFEKFFGWTLVADAKCVRLYKSKWFNEAITVPNRDMFGFTRRDECVGFLLLLEFFERESREQGVTADDKENLRFRFGDWLEYSAARGRGEGFRRPDLSGRRVALQRRDGASCTGERHHLCGAGTEVVVGSCPFAGCRSLGRGHGCRH